MLIHHQASAPSVQERFFSLPVQLSPSIFQWIDFCKIDMEAELLKLELLCNSAKTQHCNEACHSPNRPWNVLVACPNG